MTSIDLNEGLQNVQDALAAAKERAYELLVWTIGQAQVKFVMAVLRYQTVLENRALREETGEVIYDDDDDENEKLSVASEEAREAEKEYHKTLPAAYLARLASGG